MASDVTETIYVALLDEGTEVWRPVQAVRRADDTYHITSKNDDPELEQWEFPSGSVVRCGTRRLSDGDRLVGIEGVRPFGLKPVRP